MVNILLMKKSFKKGDVIFKEGDSGDEAYIVRNGYVCISKVDGDEVVELATRGPGEIVGEMALIDDRPRSATLSAKTDLQLEIMTRKELTQMLEQSPEPVQLMLHQLSERLRDADELATMHGHGH